MSISQFFNRLNISVLLFVIYYLQGVLYPSGSIISQVSLLALIVFGAYSLIETLLRKNPTAIWIWIIFTLFLALSFIASPKQIHNNIGITASTFTQFKGIIVFTLSIFIAYIATLKNKISILYLTYLFFIFFIVSIIRYFYSASVLSTEYESFTNNAGYYIVYILSFIPILIKKSKLLALLSLFSAGILIVSSSKRGAILCFIIATIIILLLYLKQYKLSFKSILIFLILIVGVSIFLYQTILSNEYLISRLNVSEEDITSGRGTIYSSLLNHWTSDSNLLTILLGNGISASFSIAGNYAHCDWFELLVDNGLLGVVLYALLFISLFRYIYMSTEDTAIKYAAYTGLTIWFLQSVISMGYTEIGGVMINFLLGIIIGNIVKNSRNLRYPNR